MDTPKKLPVADGTADAEEANARPPTRTAGDAAAPNTTDSSAGVSVSDATDAAAAGAEKPLPKGVLRRQVKAGTRYGYRFKMGGIEYTSGGADYETAEAAEAAMGVHKAQLEREAAERRAAEAAAARVAESGSRRRRPTALAAAAAAPPVGMEVDDAFPNTGSWVDAPQEEVYANVIIDLFVAGKLRNVRDGATLTATLAKLLLCRPRASQIDWWKRRSRRAAV